MKKWLSLEDETIYETNYITGLFDVFDFPYYGTKST